MCGGRGHGKEGEKEEGIKNRETETKRDRDEGATTLQVKQ